MSKMRKMILMIAAATMMILCTAIPAMADSDCRHDFFNSVCSKCGYECGHPEDMSYDYDYEYAYGYEKAGYHYETIWCRQCKSEIPKLDTISKCDVTLGKHDVYQSYHTSS